MGRIWFQDWSFGLHSDTLQEVTVDLFLTYLSRSWNSHFFEYFYSSSTICACTTHNRWAGHFSRCCGIHAQHLFSALASLRILRWNTNAYLFSVAPILCLQEQDRVVLTHHCIRTFELLQKRFWINVFTLHQLLAIRQSCNNIVTEPLDIDLRTLNAVILCSKSCAIGRTVTFKVSFHFWMIISLLLVKVSYSYVLFFKFFLYKVYLTHFCRNELNAMASLGNNVENSNVILLKQ